MKCPHCGAVGESYVIDTAPDAQGGTRRRRECHCCGKRFNTVERPIVVTPLVVKSNGEREEFDRDKVIRGIRLACAKRPVSSAEINRLVERIETQVRALGQDEVPSRVVGDMVVQGIKELDPIAYIRYAIVYLGLDNLESVRAETDKLLHEQQQQREQRSTAVEP
jgi:transcriptional repressor NrdR